MCLTAVELPGDGFWADVARRINFTFATHRTDRSPQTALLALYGALSGAIAARRAPRAGL